MKRVKLQERQHTVLLSDAELASIIQSVRNDFEDGDYTSNPTWGVLT